MVDNGGQYVVDNGGQYVASEDDDDVFGKLSVTLIWKGTPFGPLSHAFHESWDTFKSHHQNSVNCH